MIQTSHDKIQSILRECDKMPETSLKLAQAALIPNHGLAEFIDSLMKSDSMFEDIFEKYAPLMSDIALHHECTVLSLANSGKTWLAHVLAIWYASIGYNVGLILLEAEYMANKRSTILTSNCHISAAVKLIAETGGQLTIFEAQTDRLPSDALLYFPDVAIVDTTLLLDDELANHLRNIPAKKIGTSQLPRKAMSADHAILLPSFGTKTIGGRYV